MAFDAGAVVAKIKADVSDFKRGISEAVDKTKSGMNEAGKHVEGFKSKIAAIADKAKAAGATLTAIGLAAGALVKDWVGAYQEAERAQARLEQLTRQTTNATDEQIASLTEQADALQKVGVVEADTTKFGQSQLATFALQTDAIKSLTPAMLDMAVATKGVNTTQEDMINIGNMIGKVMQGQVGALSRVGVTFNAAQEKILKTGNEMERANTLAEILNQNFGGLNERMRQTSEGGIAAATNAWGDFKETLGEAVAPIIDYVAERIISLTEWLQGLNPALMQVIAVGTLVAAAIGMIGGPLLLLIGFLPQIIAGFTALGAVFSGIAFGPIGLVIAAVIALALAWKNNLFGIQEHAKAFWEFLTDIFGRLADWFNSVILPKLKVFWDAVKELGEGVAHFYKNFLLPLFTVFFTGVVEILSWFKTAWEENFLGIQTITTVIWEYIKMYFQVAFDLIVGLLRIFAKIFKGDWAGAWQEVKNTAVKIWEDIKIFFSAFWEGIKTLFKGGMGFIEKAWASSWEGMKSFFIGIWESIKQFLKDSLNWMIDKINVVIGGLNKLKIPGTDVGVNIKPVPRLAHGGIATRPTKAWVGDGGEPEVIAPLSKLRSFLGLDLVGASAPTFVFQGPVWDRSVAREIMEDAFQQMRPRLR